MSQSCIHDVGSMGNMVYLLYSVDGVMVVDVSEPVLRHVSSHRLRPSAHGGRTVET